MTMQRQMKLLRLPETTKIEGLRALVASDVPAACKLLNEVRSCSIMLNWLFNRFFQYLEQYSIVPMFNEQEFAHWFLPRENIINCYVVETEGVVTDLISFYTLPSTVVAHPTHKK